MSNPVSTSTRQRAVNRGRRRLLAGTPALAGVLAGSMPLPAASQAFPAQHWSATWGCAPAGPAPSATLAFADQTLRLIVRTSVGGNRVRIRLSNEMGANELRIGRAAIALRVGGATIASGSSRQLSFGGRLEITIPAGAPALSDPVPLALAPNLDLAVSLYLPGSLQASTVHGNAFQASYASTPGDHCTALALPQQRTISAWPFLTEVDVDAAAPVLVALGDSMTDGAGSTSNTNRRWTDWLARRAQTELGNGQLAVVNRGISANRMLADNSATPNAGKDLLERFDRDVLATAGVRALAFLIGVNDIAYSPPSAPIDPVQLFAGYLQLTERAHLHGLVVLGSTLPPFFGFAYYTSARENVRQAVNAWMRSTQPFDFLLDADLALRDPDALQQLRAAYDSGDHLHPNDAGYQALAATVPLATLASMLS